MPSDSMKRAIKKYDDEKVDRIIFRVPKGKKEKDACRNRHPQ